MAYVTARHPDLVTFEDLIAWNATDLAVRAPFGQGGGSRRWHRYLPR
jgi:hypothetical protein